MNTAAEHGRSIYHRATQTPEEDLVVNHKYYYYYSLFFFLLQRGLNCCCGLRRARRVKKKRNAASPQGRGRKPQVDTSFRSGTVSLAWSFEACSVDVRGAKFVTKTLQQLLFP